MSVRIGVPAVSEVPYAFRYMPLSGSEMLTITPVIPLATVARAAESILVVSSALKLFEAGGGVGVVSGPAPLPFEQPTTPDKRHHGDDQDHGSAAASTDHGLSSTRHVVASPSATSPHPTVTGNHRIDCTGPADTPSRKPVHSHPGRTGALQHRDSQRCWH